ncbi:MAG: extracellular solute-binding protein [Nostoc sp.]|uniref:extracellular solute-binding protein n=1 Tax=Nostoc sp. TaxID=1180 RepID=UPI002FF48A7E
MDQLGEYDGDDLLKPIREGLSNNGKLYAVPFYGESSMLYYRKDLFDRDGEAIPKVHRHYLTQNESHEQRYQHRLSNQVE